MTRADEDATVVVTGRGMASSLGDAVTACAAARAGLALPAPLDVKMRSPVDGLPDDVRGHSAGAATLGFEGNARLLRLAAGGLADLAARAKPERWRSRGAGAYLSLPDPRRVHSGLDLIPDEDTRAARAERAREAASEPVRDVAPDVLAAAADHAETLGVPDLRFCTTSGHAGFTEAVHRAAEDLRHGRVEMAIVGGVDSLVEEETVMWLHRTNRLKRAGVPVGLVPGEAAVFVTLELLRTARARGATPLGAVKTAHFEDDEAPLLSGLPARGVAMAKTIASAVGASPAGRAWLLSDHNGEAYRAVDWGLALARIAGEHPALASPVVGYPAVSFGDTGAASGGVALCVALHAFWRSAAPAPACVVVSAGDGGRRAALRVDASPQGPGSPST